MPALGSCGSLELLLALALNVGFLGSLRLFHLAHTLHESVVLTLQISFAICQLHQFSMRRLLLGVLALQRLHVHAELADRMFLQLHRQICALLQLVS